MNYKERQKLASKKFRRTPHGRACKLLSGKDHSLDPSDIARRIAAGYCEVTGLPFDMGLAGEKVARAYTPSLDRIDSTEGYTPDNVQVVVWIYNRAKGVDGHDAVLTLARALCTA